MMKKKTFGWILFSLGVMFLFMGLSRIGYSAYPYPQNYVTDQRRFDTQQAANLIMRRLQPSSTDQWAIAIVDVGGSGTSSTISTATYGVLLTTTTLSPVYSVKRFSLISIGGLMTLTTNKTDGILYLDDGMSYEQVFDNAIGSMTLTVGISTGAVYYTITGVK